MKSIDKYAYVIAIGLDKGSSAPLKMTFQIAIPISSSDTNSKSQSQDSTISTVECSSIDSGINILNDYLRKEVSLTHCKVLVFSEELASKGLSPYMNTLFNNVQLRPTCSVFVSRSDAESFLKTSGKLFQGITAKSYDSIKNSVLYNGYISNTKFGNFFAALQDTFSHGFTTLVSVNNKNTVKRKTDIVPSINSIGASSSANDLAGTSPVNRNEDSVEHLGMAVFKYDKFVGELNAIETFSHLLVTNQLREATVTIPNPLNEDNLVDLLVKRKKPSRADVKFINGTPFIEVEIFLEAKLLSIDSNTDYSNEENIKEMEDFASNYFKQNVLEYLYKTSKIYESDISSFGSKAASRFSNWKDWEDYNWLSRYQNSFFKVNVDTEIHSSSFLQRV